MRRGLRLLPMAVVALSLLGVLPAQASPAPAPTPAERAAVAYDLNGDGIAELVAGAPGLADGEADGGGGVVVLRGTRKGLSLDPQVVQQSSPGVPGSPHEFDGFGSALASGDFDADGFADLAIGESEQTVGGLESAGSVVVVHGSADGLDPARSTRFTEPGGPGTKDRFGFALAAADLTGDGYPDLAIGSPNTGAIADDGIPTGPSGRVTVLTGGPDGLSTTSSRVLHGDESTEGGDNGFGASLVTADLDGDGAVDLAVGSAGAVGPDEYAPGSVSVCPGRSGGPTACVRVAYSTDFSGSTSLSAGPVTRRDRPDLVVGAGEAGGSAGAVQILRLKAGSSPAVEQQLSLTQASKGVPGGSEDGDRFGSALAVADVDRDGYADLVVGAPGENSARGRVTLVRGAAGGWASSGNRIYDQDTAGIPGKAEGEDNFGWSVSLLDHDGDGRADLAVDAFNENASGAVTTLRGSGSSFTTKGSRTFGLVTLGVPGARLSQFGDPLGR